MRLIISTLCERALCHICVSSIATRHLIRPATACGNEAQNGGSQPHKGDNLIGKQIVRWRRYETARIPSTLSSACSKSIKWFLGGTPEITNDSQ